MVLQLKYHAPDTRCDTTWTHHTDTVTTRPVSFLKPLRAKQGSNLHHFFFFNSFSMISVSMPKLIGCPQPDRLKFSCKFIFLNLNALILFLSLISKKSKTWDVAWGLTKIKRRYLSFVWLRCKLHDDTGLYIIQQSNIPCENCSTAQLKWVCLGVLGQYR